MKQSLSTESLKKKRRIFGWLCIASFSVFLSTNFFWNPSPEDIDDIGNCSVNPSNGGTLTYSCSVSISGNGNITAGITDDNQDLQSQYQPQSTNSQSTFRHESAVYLSIVSLFTSLTTLIGFVSTTALAWKKEKREALAAEVELKKGELELEKLRLEIEKSGKKTGD